jgi:replicative DNA helicase Mcm
VTDDESQDLHETDRTGQWRDYLRQKCRKQLAEIGREFPHKRSLYIDYREVEKWGKDGIALADELIENPGKVTEDIFEAIKVNQLIRTKDNVEPKGINIRFTNLRKRTLLRDLRYDDVNRLISVEITCIRATEVRPRIVEAVFRCPGGHFTKKEQKYGKFVEPSGCATDGCQFRKLELIPKRSKFTNQQKLRVQESSEGMKAGQQPQTLDVVVLDDLCDNIFAGDRAVLNGIIRSVQRVVKGEKSTVFDLYLELSSIEITERDFAEVEITEEAERQIKEIAKSGDALEMITASIAPSIYGYMDIKRGIALQMFGGVDSVNADGTVNRPEIHILIIGDPGVSKTKLIRYAAKQSPRGIFLSAVTSSSAGLTGVTLRDEDGRWAIEAGALPLADKGVCACDEIDKAKEETTACLLSVLEDREVTVAKAGQIRTLKARCSMIFAGNPKYERFDKFVDFVDQITLPPTLLSRIDLFYIMVDEPDAKLDKERSQHVIKSRYIAECRAAGKMDRISAEDQKSVEPIISPALLKQYVAYAKRIIPIMNESVREYLTKHYVELRGKPLEKSPSPATMRQQEALVRLAEAAARSRLSSEVALKDAEIAVSVFDRSMAAVATDPNTGKVDFGRIGQGKSQQKIDMLGAMREIIKNNPKCSQALLLAKMSERSFKNEHSILAALNDALNAGDISDPGMNSHYRWEGK